MYLNDVSDLYCLFLLDTEAKHISFDFGKSAPRKRKAEMLAKEQETDRKSTLSVRYSTVQSSSFYAIFRKCRSLQAIQKIYI